MSRAGRPLRIAALLASVLLLADVPEAFLPAPEAARVLADGRAWYGTRPDGDHVRITFNPDGTGRFEGPFTLSTTWALRDEAICIHLGFILGTKCVRFRRTPLGLQAFEGSEPAFVLSR